MPPEYVTQLLPVQIIGGLSVVAAMAWLWRAVLGPASTRIRAIGQRVEDFLEGWEGRPARPGYPAEPGMPERVRVLEDLVPGLTTGMSEMAGKLESIDYHVQPNHGESAHDAPSKQLKEIVREVRGIASAQLAVSGAVDEFKDEVLLRLRRVESHGHLDGEGS